MTVRTLNLLLNEGLKPDIKAEQPINVVMVVHDNILVPDDFESPTPPKEPPSTIINNKSSYGINYDEIIVNRWDKLISKKSKIKINTVKCKLSITLRIPEELKEDL